MSETAPTTLTLTKDYESGRPDVRRGRAELQTDAPLTPINPELETTQPTAGRLFEALTQLETARAANPNGLASAKDFLRNPPKGSDDEVYLKVLECLNNANEALQPHEVRVLRHIEMELALNNAAAGIDGSVIKNHKVLVAKTTDVLNAVKDDFDQTDESEKPEKFRAFRAIANTLEDFTKNRQNNEGDKSPLAQYFEAVEAQKDNPDPDALAKASEALQKEETRQGEHLLTYTVLAGKYPVSKEQAEAEEPAEPIEKPVEKSQELIDAERELGNLRTELAAFNAKREKRIWGVDGWRGDSREMPKNKELYARYHAASQKVFKLSNPDFLTDTTISNADKIKLIAEHTVTEAGNLDTAILEDYKNKSTRFGKLIEKYGNLSTTKKILIGGLGGIAIAALTGGAGTFAWSGSVMAASFEAKRRKQRANGTDMLSFDAEKLAENYNGYDLSEADATKHLDNIFEGMNIGSRSAFENRIGKEQKKRGIRVLGSYAAGATIGTVTHNLPGGLFDGWNGPHDHIANAVSGHEVASPDLNLAPHTAPLDGLHNIYSGPSSINVNPGDGFFKVFEQMNIPQDQWNDVLGKVSSNLVGHGDAYWMPDGTAGISAPGQMSQFAFDAIKQAANFR